MTFISRRRRMRPILFLTLLVALGAQSIGTASPPPVDASAPASVFERTPDHVRVIVWDGVDDTFLARLRTIADYDVVYRYASIEGVALRVRSADQARVLAFARSWKLSAEPEVFYQADLNAATRTTFVKGTGANGSGQAWDLANGTGVTVAIIDSGIYRDHPSLNDQDLTGGGAKIVGFRDYVNGGAVVPAYDDNGHGSHVSGIAAGTGQGSAGSGPGNRGHVGVAYGANLFGLKVLDSGGTASSTNTVAAIDWMTLNGNSVSPPIRVANYSIGPIVQSPGSNTGSSANAQAMNRAVQAGIVFVQSGGNGDSDGLLPNQQEGNVGGDARYTIAVCSSNSAAPPTAPTYSNWDSEGPTADGRPKPEVCAPGDSVASADHDSNGYVSFGGTSMSSPHVAGVAALIVQAVPSITPAQVKRVIIETAREYAGTQPYNEFTQNNGWNGDRGWGEVNAKAAIQKAIADYGGNNPLSLSTGGPYTVIEGESRTLSASASFGTPPYSFAWDLNNDGTFESSGASVTFTDTATTGTRTVRARVIDSAGSPATVIASTVVDVLTSTIIFNDPVTTANGWVSSDSTAGWHITNTHANSPTQSWYAGNDIAQQYPPLTDTTLQRTFDLASGPAATSSQLLFKFARGGQMEEGFDNMVLQIKKTSDATWTTLAQWDDDLGNAWSNEAFDITSYRGFSTDIRFHFTADELFEFRGPFLDDFKIVGAVPSSDSIAPDPAVLSAGSPTTTSVTLSWTATGDDGATGQAALYDVRYATVPIDDTNFALASQASGIPSPAAPGTPQSGVVTGLDPNRTYYFAMKVGDEASNFSTISNVVSETTLPDLIPPSTPTLSGVAGNGRAELSWTASTDNIRVDSYEVFRDGALIDTVDHPTLAASATGLTNGVTYAFTVRAKDAGGLVSGLSNIVNITPIAPPAIDGWPEARGGGARTGTTAGRGSLSVPAIRQTLSVGAAAVDSSPLIVDVNGDGKADVLAVTDPSVNTSGMVKAFRQTASGLQELWSYAIPVNPGQTEGFANIAIGQLDGGGPLEVVVYSNNIINTQAVTNNQGRLAVLNAATGALIDDTSVDTTQAEAIVIGVDAPPAVADVDGDGDAEIVLIHHVGGTTPGSFLASYDLAGTSLVEEWDTNLTSQSNWTSWAVAEIRPGHPGLEVVAAQNGVFVNGPSTGAVRICSPAGGNANCTENAATTTGIAGVSVADLDGDGNPEIVGNGRTGQSLNVFKTAPGLSLVSRADGFLWNTASLADVDGDGNSDIVNVAYSGQSTFPESDPEKKGDVTVRGWNGTAISTKGTLSRTPPPGGDWGAKGGGALIDIAGDTRPELIYGQRDGKLVAVGFSAAGVPSLLWEIALSGVPNAPVAAGDVTGDGLLDLVAGTANGNVVVLGAGPLAGIAISPASSSIVAGGTQTYAVEGFDAAGNSLGDVTASTSFAITGGSCAGATCGSTVAGDHIVTATKDGKTAAATLTVTPGPLASMAIDPASATVAAGQGQGYTVTGEDQYGNSIGNVTATTTFAVAPDGSCSANTCSATVSGPHTVTASNAGVTEQSALQVNPGPLASLVLAPAETTVVLGSSQAYTAQGRDAFGNSLGDLTAGTTFAIFPNGSCSGAVCTPAALGDHTVRAARGTAQGSAVMHVIPESIYRIEISPATATITAGGSQTYTAEGFDESNASVGDVTGVTVFSIGPNGSCSGNVCTATAAGPHTVVGNVSGTGATAQLNVVAGPTTGISLSPALSQIPAGGSRTYTVLGRDQYGNATGDLTSSATLAIAPDGSCSGNTCTASVYGDHTVTATVAPSTATATLRVVPPAPSIATPVQDSVNGPSIEVTGSAPTGTTVTLWDNGTKIAEGIAVAPDGSWTHTRSFTDGSHAMTAFAVAGSNVSAPSAARVFSVDGTAPTTTVHRRQGYIVAQIYHPLEDVVVEGVARDANSGVASVEVAYAGAETVVDLIACASPCAEFRWRSTPDLLPGVYTVRAVPIDRAGNRGSAVTINIVTLSLTGGGSGSASAIRPNVVE